MTLLNRPSINIAFSTEALKANLSRLENEWEIYQTTRSRDGIYQLFGRRVRAGHVVEEHKAVEYAHRALWLQAISTLVKEPEPFAAVIFCTADPEKVDYRMRSKWSRVLRYAADVQGSG